MTLGPKLTDQDEALFRQVHPDWIQAGRPTSQAFRPSPKDEGLLSVARGSKTTAAAAFELHTQRRSLRSVGVWGFRLRDCSEIGLDAYDDPVATPVPDPAHAVVDFLSLGHNDIRAKSQLLKARAEPVFVQKPEDH